MDFINFLNRSYFFLFFNLRGFFGNSIIIQLLKILRSNFIKFVFICCLFLIEN